MSTILREPPGRLVYTASDGSKQEFTIRNKDNVRGMMGPELWHLAEEPGHFILQRSFGPLDRTPARTKVHSRHRNYWQATRELHRIEGRLRSVVELHNVEAQARALADKHKYAPPNLFLKLLGLG